MVLVLAPLPFGPGLLMDFADRRAEAHSPMVPLGMWFALCSA